MTKHEFDIDLFWLGPKEPENWFDTIEVPLSDEEVAVLVDAIIDQHFILPRRPNYDIEGDDYLIIERAPQVYARIIKQMEEEADARGWSKYISKFKEANIWFGYSLGDLARNSPRWKEIERAKTTRH